MALKEKLADEVGNRLRENLDIGWISPEGDYYGCGSGGHFNILSKTLGFSSGSNIADWILVGAAECRERQSHWLNYGVMCGHDEVLTNEQRETLEKIGFNADNPYQKRDCQVEFRDAFPRGYQDHAIPYVEELDKPLVENTCALDMKIR